MITKRLIKRVATRWWPSQSWYGSESPEKIACESISVQIRTWTRSSLSLSLSLSQLSSSRAGLKGRPTSRQNTSSVPQVHLEVTWAAEGNRRIAGQINQRKSVCDSGTHHILGSLWGHFGIMLGSLWNHFGIILGSRWDHFGIILRSLWDHVGVILGSLWNHFGVIRRGLVPQAC